jgi:SAM-dependent methyltransferase
LPASARDLGLSFGRAVADYERGRPEWPDEAIDHTAGALGLTARAAVLDLAAGTGRLTRKLVPRFHRVVAVEPDDAMRTLMERLVPEAEALRGTARTIPLSDREVDAVFVAEAFHWFAGADEVGEIARVLLPRGGLVLLWHKPLDPMFKRVPWSDPRRDDQRAETGTWRGAFADSPFEPLREARFEHVQRAERADVLAYFASISPVASLPEDERKAILDQIDLLLDRDIYARRWQIDAYWTRLRE